MYSPSFAITTHGAFAPDESSLGSIFFTSPETELTILADINPLASPMICPIFTVSPTATTGVAGAPMCWLMENTSSSFGSITWIGLSILSSFPSYGCVPPLKVDCPNEISSFSEFFDRYYHYSTFSKKYKFSTKIFVKAALCWQ